VDADADRDRLRRRAVRAVLRSLAISVLIVTGYFALPMNHALGARDVLTLFVGLAVVAGALAWQIRAILESSFPAARAVQALLVSVPLFLVVFSAVYFLMGENDPASWSQPLTRLDALYFTVTVFTTVGFGDITAVSEAARAVTIVQMISGLVLVAVIARLVVGAVHISWERKGRTKGPGSTPFG
jgi:voltage-gated potassium channel